LFSVIHVTVTLAQEVEQTLIAGRRCAFPAAAGPSNRRLASWCEDEPERRSAAKLLTNDEARWIPEKIAKLPEIVRTHEPVSSAPVSVLPANL
jgi:hypothetical protein